MVTVTVTVTRHIGFPVPGEVCTDDNANADNTNASANDGQSMIVWGSLVDKPNEPKTTEIHVFLCYLAYLHPEILPKFVVLIQ